MADFLRLAGIQETALRAEWATAADRDLEMTSGLLGSPTTHALSVNVAAQERCGSLMWGALRIKGGFTVVELLVVIVIIGTLVGLVVPAVQTARESARRFSCLNNLKQMGLALESYHAGFRTFPVGQYVDSNGHGWGSAILPHMEQVAVFDKLDFGQPYFHPANRSAGETIIPTYLCPSAATRANDRVGNRSWGLGAIDYGCMLGAVAPLAAPPNSDRTIPYTESRGVFPWPPLGSRRPGVSCDHAAITDGASHTIVVGEDSGRGIRDGGVWIAGASLIDQQLPGINLTNDNELFSDHPSGVNVVLADGSCHFLADTIDLKVLVALCNRDDGMPAPTLP